MANDESKRLRPLTDRAREEALHCLDLAERLAGEAFRRCGRMVPLDELLGVARLALVCAASRYHEQMGVPFPAWATLVIRHELLRAVNWWRRRDRVCFLRLPDRLAQDASVGGPPFDVPCPWAGQAALILADQELLERLRRALPQGWFQLLLMRYVEERSLEEIGQRVGLSAERVRYLLAEAIRRIRRLYPDLRFE